MIDLTDRAHMPDMAELSAYIANPLFEAMCADMTGAYNAHSSVEYSGDKQLLGWNLRFFRAGRTLCRLYPRPGCFLLLIVVGRKEKERAEALLPQMSVAMQELYNTTKEGMGQRWLLVELRAPDALYRDAQTLIRLRRESK